MRVVEQIGKTPEEAKAAALKKLGVESEDEVEIEVLDEGSKGVFGWGTKYARVRVKIKDDSDQKVEEVIRQLLMLMGIKATVEKNEEGFQELYAIYGDNLGHLIGRRGQTLEAMQFIVNLIINKGQTEKTKIVLDIEGYRMRRERNLRSLAQRAAQQARRERKPFIMEPMLPSERRIIHLALKNNPDVETHSEGQEPMRKVVITPRKRVPGASSFSPRDDEERNAPLPRDEQELENLNEPQEEERFLEAHDEEEEDYGMPEIEEHFAEEEEGEIDTDEEELPPPSNFDRH